MKALQSALVVMGVLATAALAAPPPGGPPPRGAPPEGARPGGPPPSHAVYAGGSRGHWHAPGVRFYFGAPYFGGGWGWPGYSWPGYNWPGYYYGPGYGYLAPNYVYGPAAVVTATDGVVYIEREPGTVSTQRPVAAPAPEGTSATPPPPGTSWWYLCSSPRGAYPYVRECPGGWERVPAVPPGPVK